MPDAPPPAGAPARPDVSRSWAASRVMLVALAANVVAALVKILTGRLFGIVSMTADGVHSLIDALGNVVGILALASASRPPDDDHPYGHQKFETFAGLGIALVMGAGGVLLVHDAVARVGSGTEPDADPVTFVVALGTTALYAVISFYEARRGRALGSELLIADSKHTWSDVLVSLSVIGALVGIRLGMPAVDLVSGVFIAGFIALAAWSILRGSLDVLSDAAVIETARVEAVARKVAGVRSCHKIRTRGQPQHVFVDLHIQVDPRMATIDSHRLGHEVADALKREIAGVVDVLVHVEPDR